MRWSDVIYFPTEIISENDIGDTIKTSGTPRQVFANQKSIRQTEFYQAQSTGLRPEIMFEVRTVEYQDESELIFNNKTYSIIRAYDKNGEITELICQGLVNRANA